MHSNLVLAVHAIVSRVSPPKVLVVAHALHRDRVAFPLESYSLVYKSGGPSASPVGSKVRARLTPLLHSTHVEIPMEDTAGCCLGFPEGSASHSSGVVVLKLYSLAEMQEGCCEPRFSYGACRPHLDGQSQIILPMTMEEGLEFAVSYHFSLV